jgi:signal peptidase I
MRRVIRDAIETLLMALVIYLALQFSVQPYKVEGSSMSPTMSQGQYLLVNKLVYWHVSEKPVTRILPFLAEDNDSAAWPTHTPRHGEIIIFEFPMDPSRNFIKRVIGVPGDQVLVRNGRVYLNEAILDEPYLSFGHTECNGRYACNQSFTVPPNSYFVMGDNRSTSDDSRHWGIVPAGHVIGRAFISYWPLHYLKESLGF